MIKIIFLFTLGGFMLSSCPKNSPLDAMNCPSLLLKYADDAQAMYANPTPASCKKAKNSLNKVMQNCSQMSKEDRDGFEKDMKDFDCN